MLNPIALDKLNEWFGTCHKAMMGRNGTGGEPSQMLLNAVNAGVEFAAIAAAAVVSIAYDVRAIRAELTKGSRYRLCGLSNKSEGL